MSARGEETLCVARLHGFVDDNTRFFRRNPSGIQLVEIWTDAGSVSAFIGTCRCKNNTLSPRSKESKDCLRKEDCLDELVVPLDHDT